jgi:hypothetical protein
MFNMRYVAWMPRYAETVFPVKKVIALSNDMAKRIRDYRFTERIESENEAIRRLIEAGLSTSGKSGPLGDGGAGGKSKPRATKPPSSPEKPKPAPRSTAPATSLTKEAQLRARRENRA